MTCTEIKEGSPRHLHRLIRGGLSPTVGSAMTRCSQKGGWQVHRRGKTTAVISGQGGVGSEEVGPGGFFWRQLNSLDARRKMLGGAGPRV